MNGLDQIVMALLFLPVVLFIVIPLCVGIIGLPRLLFVKLVKREANLESYNATPKATVTA